MVSSALVRPAARLNRRSRFQVRSPIFTSWWYNDLGRAGSAGGQMLERRACRADEQAKPGVVVRGGAVLFVGYSFTLADRRMRIDLPRVLGPGVQARK